MKLTEQTRLALKQELVTCLAGEQEIRRIVIFGSFLTSSNPCDMDIAIFQDGKEAYLPLAMKYRRQARSVARQIPLDIIPLSTKHSRDVFSQEIEAGETVYER